MNLDPLREVVLDLHAHTRDLKVVRGFAIPFHPTNDLTWLNGAYPLADFDPEGLAEVEAAFAERGRQPFFEFAIPFAPDLPGKLAANGYEEVFRSVIMVHEGPIPDPHVARIPTDDELAHMSDVSAPAFGQEVPPPLTGDDLARAKADQESGAALSSVVVVDGNLVSVGQAVGDHRAREFVGIATLETHRRKGHAADVLADLLHQHKQKGAGVAWLTPGDPNARALYEKVGFRAVADYVAYLKPT
ncbi:MAG: GNAT family N-acetyltransferase [Armatimonadetes bacterium]|nr:GNAT family N-acetyltransferase [Armatimonadota bacterium]